MDRGAPSLFSLSRFSPFLPPTFAPITQAVTGYEVAAGSLIPCPFPTGNLKNHSERGEWLQTIEEWDIIGKEGTASEAAIFLTFYISPPFLTWKFT